MKRGELAPAIWLVVNTYGYAVGFDAGEIQHVLDKQQGTSSSVLEITGALLHCTRKRKMFIKMVAGLFII